MSKKIRVLLQINTMMKQNTEARLAELSEAKLKYDRLIGEVKSEVSHQEQDLKRSECLDEYHMDYLNFEKWRQSQLNKVNIYREECEKLLQAQNEIKKELAELIVKEAHFQKSLKANLDQKKLADSQLESERTQNIWLQSRR